MARHKFEWLLTLSIVTIFAVSINSVLRVFNGKDTLYYLTDFVEKAHFIVFIFYAFLFFISIGFFLLFYSTLQAVRGPYRGGIEKEWRMGFFRIWKTRWDFYISLLPFGEIGILLYLWNFGRNNTDGDFEWWEWYGFNPVKRWWKRRMAKHIMDLSGPVNSGKTILHLGCGSSPLINEFHCRNIGIDKNEEKIKFLGGKTDAELYVDDIVFCDYPKSDIIVCSEALEYLARGQEDTVLEKISDALNDGGRVIVTFPNSNSGVSGVIEKILHKKERQVHGIGEYNPVDRDYIGSLAGRHGLQIIDERHLLTLDCAYLLVRDGDS